MPPTPDALRRAGDRVETPEDLAADLAAGYPRTRSAGARVDRVTVGGDLAAVERDGYVLLPELLTPGSAPRSGKP
ncbi:hypothetical protein [Streptomyces sp. NPDC059015]|uniref:hypothetical protein n=1 Tax=unclassified Streptomyces TaxID=2593676 RepID=UPI0036CC332C